MATTRKISPRNLPGITKLFQEQAKETKKKLGSLNKTRAKLEKQLAVLQDGLEFCEQIYEAGKPKATKVKEGKAAAQRFERMIGD